jgi:hypothetical protein
VKTRFQSSLAFESNLCRYITASTTLREPVERDVSDEVGGCTAVAITRTNDKRRSTPLIIFLQLTYSA